MTRLLHIEASPRREASFSSFGGRVVVAAVQARRPNLVVDRLNVWEEDLPPFDGAALAAKYDRLAKRELDGEKAAAWSTIEAIVARVQAADSVLLTTPMWNFGIPYRLKHWFDLITQPGLTFSFDPTTGYAPLLPSRPVLVVMASSGDYSKGRSWGRPDLATPYLAEALKFIGLTDAAFETVSPTAGPPDLVEAAKRSATARLQAAAATL